MKTAAIICEYNPFHNGHKYHIGQTKKLCGADAVVAVMSGNFVQRGDAAIFEKTARANAAIMGGADLVLELPTVFAMQSAEFFAKHSVFILDSLGCIDFLSFGAETENIDALINIANILADEPKEFSENLKQKISLGIPFPIARQEALHEIMGIDAEMISEPNNILAVEYLKALKILNSKIKPIAIKRTGCSHDSDATSDGFASASHIRTLLLSGKDDDAYSLMPPFAEEIFKSENKHSAKAMEKAIIGEILKMSIAELSQISDVSEGIENRIKDKATLHSDLGSLADAIKTKRYTHSRIRRILLSSYLKITNEDRNQTAPYVKVLAHNETGQRLIREMKKTASLPIVRNTSQVNKLNSPTAKAFWERERIFDKLYEMMI